MKSQKLYSYDGDTIAIGISGGKDSLTLLYALSGLKIFYPNKFQLVAITVDLGFGIQDLDKIKDYCKKFDVEYHVIETQISDVIAYAHHKDDIIETMFLSLIYEGRFHCFSPVTYLDKKRLTVIRPLMYVPEMDVIGFAKRYELPVAKNRCPVDGHTKREYVKNLVRQLVKENPGCKERFFTAIMNGCYNMDK